MATRKRSRTTRKPVLPPKPNPKPQFTTATPRQLLNHLSKPKDWTEYGKSRPLRTTPTRRRRKPASSGFFDILPLELIEMILLTLDYPSLAHLSALNTKIEALLKTRPWYKLILEYCASALKSMARLKILHLHTAASISKAFFNPNCSSPGCTALTDNLFLPTCRRYCNSCLGTTPTSTAVCSYFVIEDYNISWEECAANMPTMRSADAGFQSFVCALEDDVVVYAREKYGKARIIPASFKARFWSSLTTIRFPFVDSESKGVEFGRWCRACVEAFDAHMRLWTELETVSRREEDNKRMGEELKEKAETVYNTKQLLWHVQSGECTEAQEFWYKKANRR